MSFVSGEFSPTDNMQEVGLKKKFKLAKKWAGKKGKKAKEAKKWAGKKAKEAKEAAKNKVSKKNLRL